MIYFPSIALTLFLGWTVAATSSIPSEFSSAFNPSQISLQIAYNGQQIPDGTDLTKQDTSKAPSFALGDSSGLNTNAKYTIAMVDMDASKPNTSPQTLHFMQQDFQADGNKLEIASKTPPVVPWLSPASAQGSGSHRFAFLLFEQPSSGFQAKGVSSSQRNGFDIVQWQKNNNLKSAIAGVQIIIVLSGSGSTTTQAGSTTTTSTVAVAAASSTGTTINVVVGGIDGVLVYHPENVMANVGDTVRFDFLAKNHTVTQSSLANPCTFMTGGKKSGFKPNLKNTMGVQLFDFLVEDTMPKWFFCGQTGHCGKGMVFAINPGDKFTQFKNAALAIGAAAAASSSAGTSAASVSTSTVAAAAPPPSPPPPPPPAATTTSEAATSTITLAQTTAATIAATSVASVAADTAVASTVVADTSAASAAAPPTGLTLSVVGGTSAAAASSAVATDAVAAAPGAAAGAVGGATIKVTVGGPAGLVYTPNQVTANVGDIVVFDFLSVNHTASQSTLANPCTLMPGGFASGFMPNPNGVAGMFTKQFPVTDTMPKWFYCAQTGHCSKGMVFAINPGAKFDQFLANAKSLANGTAASNASAPGTPPVAVQAPGSGASSLVFRWEVASIAGLLSLILLGA